MPEGGQGLPEAARLLGKHWRTCCAGPGRAGPAVGGQPQPKEDYVGGHMPKLHLGSCGGQGGLLCCSQERREGQGWQGAARPAGALVLWASGGCGLPRDRCCPAGAWPQGFGFPHCPCGHRQPLSLTLPGSARCRRPGLGISTATGSGPLGVVRGDPLPADPWAPWKRPTTPLSTLAPHPLVFRPATLPHHTPCFQFPASNLDRSLLRLSRSLHLL